MSKSDDVLAPCPFCGSKDVEFKAALRDNWLHCDISCDGCGVVVQEGAFADGISLREARRQTIRDWNRRASDDMWHEGTIAPVNPDPEDRFAIEDAFGFLWVAWRENDKWYRAVLSERDPIEINNPQWWLRLPQNDSQKARHSKPVRMAPDPGQTVVKLELHCGAVFDARACGYVSKIEFKEAKGKQAACFYVEDMRGEVCRVPQKAVEAMTVIGPADFADENAGITGRKERSE